MKLKKKKKKNLNKKKTNALHFKLKCLKKIKQNLIIMNYIF